MNKKTLSVVLIVASAILVFGCFAWFTRDVENDDSSGGLLGPIPGIEDKESETIDPAACQHTVTEETILVESKCNVSGIKQISCKICGNVEQERMPVLAHEWEEDESSLEGCELVQSFICKGCRASYQVGTGKYYHEYRYGACIVCGADDPSYDTEDNGTGDSENTGTCVSGHSYTTISSSSPTCTSAGYTTSKCSKCGSTVTESTPALGHSYVTIRTDVNDDGSKAFVKECSKCGDTIVT